MLDLMAGKRRISPVVNLAAANVAVVIVVISNFAGMVGVKTMKIKRIKIRNNNGGNTWVHIGNGIFGAWTDRIPALYSISNTTDDYDEDDLPQVESILTLAAYPEAVGGGSFDVQIEVEDVG